jgi:hypothetical protein
MTIDIEHLVVIVRGVVAGVRRVYLRQKLLIGLSLSFFDDSFVSTEKMLLFPILLSEMKHFISIWL